MNDLTIIFENETQRTRLYLNWELRMIDEETIYFQEDKTIFKTSLQREIYQDEISLISLKKFFESQLNSLTEFYRTKGKFEIKL